jgi:hypothetical protein
MSTTFFAPDAPAATEGLEINMSSSNAGMLTILLGLDTKAAIDERGMVAGEMSAPRILTAIRQQDATGSDYFAFRMRELRALAEAANAYGSTVAWA